MGAVYLAEHEVLNRQIALKVMLDQFAKNSELRERMAREARTMSELDHPNIVKVLDHLQFPGGIALVLEYVEGRDLEQMIGREVGPIPYERALPLFRQLLGAVTYAHKRGIVHRDLKPSNVLVTKDNQIKVTDFGIAKVAGQSKLTRTGTMLGTPVYMPPEQILGRAVDHRADIYSLGMTLYVMLAGRPPFDDEDLSEFAFMKACLEDPIPDPRDFYPYIPKGLVKITMKMLERDRGKRYGDCDRISIMLDKPDNEYDDNSNLIVEKSNSKTKGTSLKNQFPKQSTKYHSGFSVYREILDIIHNEIHSANPAVFSQKFMNEIDFMLTFEYLDLVIEIDNKINEGDAEFIWLRARILEKLGLPNQAQKYYKISYSDGFSHAREYIKAKFVFTEESKIMYITIAIVILVILAIIISGV